MNKLIKLSRNFIILGIALMIFAVIMNHGKIPLFANHYEEKHYVKLADNIKSINIDTVNVDVVVESSNSNNIEVSYFDSNISQYKITDNDGTLVIKEQDDNILKLNFNFITKKKDLIIKVPKKLVPELELSNNVGNVKLEKLNITNLSVDNSAGNTVISDINSENGEININSQSGNINLTNLNNFNIANIKTSFGSTSLNDSSSNKFNIESSTGNININDLNNSSVESITCKISTGNIDAKNINASKLISLEVQFGNVYANISDKEDNYSNSGNTFYSKSGSKLILIKTEHGDSRTNFIN